MPGAWQYGQMCTWPRSLELQLPHEGEGLALGTAPLCLHPCGSETVPSGEPPPPAWSRSASQLAFKDGGKTFLGGRGCGYI